MRLWNIVIPIQVFDDKGNFVPEKEETRLDKPTRTLTIGVLAISADMAVEKLANKMGIK